MNQNRNVIVFHAGTKQNPTGNIITAGGRVLGVTALGDSIEISIDRAYQTVSEIQFKGASFRKDIAHQANLATFGMACNK